MDNDFTPLRNLFNEWLVRDTSKNIKAVKRAKGMSGKPVTSKPVYGYLMDEDENLSLIHILPLAGNLLGSAFPKPCYAACAAYPRRAHAARDVYKRQSYGCL